MRKYLLALSFTWVCVITASAQVLTAQKHLPHRGDTLWAYPHTYQRFLDSGQNCVWDFSGIKIDLDSILQINWGTEKYTNETGDKSWDILFEDFGLNHFRFNYQKDTLKLITERVVRTNYLNTHLTPVYHVFFDTPVPALSFPFKYGDILTTPINGSTSGVSFGEIEGRASVCAPATGMLLLPDRTIDSCLLVKWNISFEVQKNQIEKDVTYYEELRYFWFSEIDQHPIYEIDQIKINGIACRQAAYLLSDSIINEMDTIGRFLTQSFDTICSTDSLLWNNRYISKPGSYVETFISTSGLDSIESLYLTVNDTYAIWDTVRQCSENHIGSVKDTILYLNTIHGCDSIVHLHTELYPSYEQDIWKVAVEGETISWEGNTYNQPGDYTAKLTSIHGCDSIVTLHLSYNLVQLTIDSVYQCADDPFVRIYPSLTQGTIDSVKILFTDDAKQIGFCDTTLLYEPTLQIHNPGRAGHYGLTIRCYFQNKVVYVSPVEITLLYPASIIEQNWSDFLAVLTHDYNGGYDFYKFQWYCDNQALIGETHSYLYGNIHPGATYSVLLTDTTGMELMSCGLMIPLTKSLSVSPTILKRHQPIHIRVSVDAHYDIYDILGRIVNSGNLIDGDNTINAPSESGIHFLHITTLNNVVHTTQIIIE